VRGLRARERTSWINTVTDVYVELPDLSATKFGQIGVQFLNLAASDAVTLIAPSSDEEEISGTFRFENDAASTTYKAGNPPGTYQAYSSLIDYVKKTLGSDGDCFGCNSPFPGRC